LAGCQEPDDHARAQEPHQEPKACAAAAERHPHELGSEREDAPRCRESYGYPDQPWTDLLVVTDEPQPLNEVALCLGEVELARTRSRGWNRQCRNHECGECESQTIDPEGQCLRIVDEHVGEERLPAQERPEARQPHERDRCQRPRAVDRDERERVCVREFGGGNEMRQGCILRGPPHERQALE
jgi:hypothetical protein